ncbi:MAG TPA: sigma-70 family RNA polymerase sigma factor [Thermoanaerobaculia bacterium]|nr:sigma-70 family RNA polymerase sigma factor [Thermoanaerobaculia bacterium]
MTAPRDASPWDELARRYRGAIVGDLMRRFGFSREDAEDIAQETFLSVHKSMDRYRGEAEWMYLRTAAHNFAKNWFRRAQTKMRDERLNTPIDAVPDRGDRKPSIEEKLVRREQTRHFNALYRDALAGLPDLTRDCFLLLLRDVSYKEIAAVTKLTVEAVRSRLREARKRLREEVGAAPEGINWPEVAEEDDDEHEI